MVVGAHPFDSFESGLMYEPNVTTTCFGFCGFTLPTGSTTFPNRPVSLFVRAADVRYGEATLPLSPLRSRRAAAAGTEVIHRFTLTNAGTAPMESSSRLSASP